MGFLNCKTIFIFPFHSLISSLLSNLTVYLPAPFWRGNLGGVDYRELQGGWKAEGGNTLMGLYCMRQESSFNFKSLKFYQK